MRSAGGYTTGKRAVADLEGALVLSDDASGLDNPRTIPSRITG